MNYNLPEFFNYINSRRQPLNGYYIGVLFIKTLKGFMLFCFSRLEEALWFLVSERSRKPEVQGVNKV